MEQYEIAKEIIYDDLKFCLNNFKAERVYIRGVGSRGGGTKLDEYLEDNSLWIEQTEQGLLILIDNEERFLFKQDEEWGRDFSVGYERDLDERGRIPMLPTGIDPDDPKLPPVLKSSFMCANYDDFLQLFFKGKIPLKFHSWFDKEIGWKYWCVDRDAVVMMYEKILDV